MLRPIELCAPERSGDTSIAIAKSAVANNEVRMVNLLSLVSESAELKPQSPCQDSPLRFSSIIESGHPEMIPMEIYRCLMDTRRGLKDVNLRTRQEHAPQLGFR